MMLRPSNLCPSSMLTARSASRSLPNLQHANNIYHDKTATCNHERHRNTGLIMTRIRFLKRYQPLLRANMSEERKDVRNGVVI